MLQLPDGNYTETREEAISHLLSVHFPRCAPTTAVDQDLPQNEEGNWDLAKRVVTQERVTWAIRTFSAFKAAGPDGIFPGLLQGGLEFLLTPLVALFQTSIARAYIPSAWRDVRVVFIAKPGKESYAQAKSFRPISLSSFVLKALERLVDRFIRDGALLRNPLHSNQHAYQVGKSVDSALHTLVGRLEKAIDQKEYALAVFFDIAGAFDNAQFGSMEQALRGKGVDETLIK